MYGPIRNHKTMQKQRGKAQDHKKFRPKLEIKAFSREALIWQSSEPFCYRYSVFNFYTSRLVLLSEVLSAYSIC